MAKKVTQLEIDMCAGSQLRDTQGEVLSVEGADISELQAGKGRFNDNHGKGFFNSVGRITEAKKIFSKDDCENERHEYYWEKIRAPYVYVRGYLYNDEDHPNAKAAAAVLKSIHKVDAPLKLKASVEGGVVQRGIKDSSLLAKTKIHSVALTFTPANNATLVEPLNLEKRALSSSEERLIKSVAHLAESKVPSFIDISEKLSIASIGEKVENISLMTKALKNINNKEKMEKSLKALKNLAVATALAQGAHTMSPMNTGGSTPTENVHEMRDVAGVNVANQTKSPYLMSHPELIDHIKNDHPHLWAIAQAESSGGKNLNHKTMESGMHRGHTAGGPWGLMPNTVEFIVQNLDKEQAISNVYPQLYHMTKTPENTDKYHKELTGMINSSPMMSFKLASTLYNHLHNVHEGDKHNITHSWLHGATGTKRQVRRGGPESVKEHPYVQRVHQHKENLKKALTAGYGGAGAPTNLTGGGVMQSESFGGAKNGKFKYITCNNCGKEQVHASNQVKCRNCNNSFSLEQILKLMN